METEDIVTPTNAHPAAYAADSAVAQAIEKKSQYYTLLYTEMQERRRAEEHLRRSNALLKAISAAQLQFVAGAGLQSVLHSLLESLVAVTGSTHGMIAEFTAEFTAAEKPLRSRRRQCRVLAEASAAPAPDTGNTGETGNTGGGAFDDLIAPAMAAQAEVCIPGGQEDGARRRLALPFVTGGAALGMLALAAPGLLPLDAELPQFLQPAVAACAQLILASRSEQRRKEAEGALADERALLAQRVEERTAELQLVNAELGRAMRAKDEFLATINHELRSPLGAILLSTETLSYQVHGPLNARQLRTVQNIEESTNHLLSLINEMLDVAKMEAGKLTIDIKTCQVEVACQASLRLVAEAAEKGQLNLRYRIDNVWEIEADERRLVQILVNLLSNAIKFTPPGGSVGLEVTGNSETDIVEFAVWDTGIGIAAEDMHRLFQPFSQVDNSRAHQRAGTGLGLALVYRMAELHGGSVTVASTPGEGSRFTVSLPRRHGANRRAPVYTPLVASGEPPVILLADDNEACLEALAGYLELFACRLVLARNGREAVEETRRQRPHLVLMDVQMPELDGLQAMHILHTDPELAPIPIVAMTALVTPADRERCLAAGAVDLLVKPIVASHLQQVLQDYVNCGPPARPAPCAAATVPDAAEGTR